MTDLSRAEVLKALAAGEFSAAFALYLDVLVTLDFARIGVRGPHEARDELQRFLKAASSWLSERRLPVVWIACIERGGNGGFHAHIAIHVPGMRRDGNELRGIRYRTHFRRWAREAVARRVGEVVPRAINVRCSLVPSIISHWISVTYLLKGFDRRAMLEPDDGPDTQELFLGDILPFPYRDPGEIGLDRRLFVSGNLGPARRSFGAPPGGEFMLPRKPDVLSLRLTSDCEAPQPQRTRAITARPFRAAVEEGVFDVRQIYGAEFAAFVTGIKPVASLAPPEGGHAYNPDLLTFLHDLEI